VNSPNNPRKRAINPTQQVLLSVVLVLAVLLLTAQSCVQDPGVGPIPQPPGSPTPCSGPCPPSSGPPAGPVDGAHEITKTHYSFYYFNPPWTEDKSNSDANTESLYRDTDYGQVSAQFFTASVSNGTTASQLLSSWTQQHLDPNKFTAFQDSGPIAGAEIGYNAGAGETYEAIADLPNAPSTPLFIEVLSSVKGTTGIIFAVVSPLDPLNPDPNSPIQVRSGSYDRLINTLVWI
jgi:hypothetical protein